MRNTVTTLKITIVKHKLNHFPLARATIIIDNGLMPNIGDIISVGEYTGCVFQRIFTPSNEPGSTNHSWEILAQKE